MQIDAMLDGRAASHGAGRAPAPWAAASRLRRAGMALIGLFALAGAARLNDLALFNPDSAHFLILARSLVSATESPTLGLVDAPLWTWRPPGLPLLLAPAAVVAPLSAVAAKTLTLGCGIASLLLVYALARRLSDDLGAVLAVAGVATSPHLLILATEVLSEAPFVAALLGALLVVGDRPERPALRRALSGGALLALTPLLRTIGLALPLAVALWALPRRARWRWLAAALVSLLPAVGWLFLVQRTQGPTYAGVVSSVLQRLDLAAALESVGQGVVFYAARASEILLPGAGSQPPLYDLVLASASPRLGAPLWLAGPVLLLAVIGCLKRRRSVGAIALAFTCLYGVALCVYPMKHERLVWPLTVLAWTLAPCGWRSVARSLERFSARWAALAGGGVTVVVLLVAGWQASLSAAVVATNVRWRLDPQRFYAAPTLPYYFCDWAAAGRWVRKHTPPHARLLVGHASAACTTDRRQEWVRLEHSDVPGLTRKIDRFGARYVVAARFQFGRGFPWRLLMGHPALQLAPVYEARNVVVLEVRPNRTGIVSEAPPVDEALLAACRRSVNADPRNPQLRVRLAELLEEFGRTDDAEETLRQAYAAGVVDLGVVLRLGQLAAGQRRYRDALRLFDEAASLPEAETLAGLLAAESARARRALAAGSGGQAAPPSLQDLIAAARSSLARLRYRAAWASLELARRAAPAAAEVHELEGELLQRFGRFDEAERAFVAAWSAGATNAAAKVRLLRWLRAVAAGRPTVAEGGDAVETVDPRNPETVVALARMLIADGTPGRALNELERASSLFPNHVELLRTLGDLYARYALWDECVTARRRLVQLAPADRSARDALRRAEQRLASR